MNNEFDYPFIRKKYRDREKEMNKLDFVIDNMNAQEIIDLVTKELEEKYKVNKEDKKCHQ